MSHAYAYLSTMGITLWERRKLSHDDENDQVDTNSLGQHTDDINAERVRDEFFDSGESIGNVVDDTSRPSQGRADTRTSDPSPQPDSSHQSLSTHAVIEQSSLIEKSLDNDRVAHRSQENTPKISEASVLSNFNANGQTLSPTNLRNDDSDTTAAAIPTTSVSQGYLVLPKGTEWKTGGLTVICRHEPGQPAQSYVRNGVPSKTMTNLLLGFQALLPDDAPSLIKNTNFAQLSSTALSENAVAATQALRQYPPKAILIMGAAAANQLLQGSHDIGQWQARSWTSPEGIPLVITYHPYDIFTSPILKRQVFKDLLALRQWFIDG